MKKFLKISVLALPIIFYGSSGYVLADSSLFQNGQEVNMGKFFAFDPNKYKFSDHERIIGGDFEEWDGDPKNLRPAEKDFKKINVTYKGIKAKIQFAHHNGKGVSLRLWIHGDTPSTRKICENYKNFIPTKYINKNHFKDFRNESRIEEITLRTLNHTVQSSYDFDNNRRLKVNCWRYDISSEYSTGRGNTYFGMEIGLKHYLSKVYAFKRILCTLTGVRLEAERPPLGVTPDFEKKTKPEKMSLFIDDTKHPPSGLGSLHYSNYERAGESKVFNDLRIHTVKETKTGEEPNRRIIHRSEWDIDRTTGEVTVLVEKPNKDFGWMKITNYGNCELQKDVKKF